MEVVSSHVQLAAVLSRVAQRRPVLAWRGGTYREGSGTDARELILQAVASAAILAWQDDEERRRIEPRRGQIRQRRRFAADGRRIGRLVRTKDVHAGTLSTGTRPAIA